MRIDLDALDGLVLTDLAPPHLYPAQVEALLPREPIDGRRRLTGERQLVRLVGQCQTRVVGDILAESQLAVDVIAVHRLVSVVLRDQCLGSSREFRMIFRREPIPQIAVRIVLTALIVEAMTDLVTDAAAA